VIRVGVCILPEHPWATGRELWRRAEALGFAHAWTYDHLAWRSLRDSPWYSAIPTLTAAAVVTERMRLGTLVASPNFRHPVPFARELLALDDVSAGRLTLGIGAGGLGYDTEMLGQEAWTLRERADRFAEFLALLDRLLREREVSSTGTYYSAVEARSYPGCVQVPRVPFAVAAVGPRALRLAATYGDTWVTTGDRAYGEPAAPEAGARVVREQVDRLEAACAAVGRDPATIGRLVLTGPALDPAAGSVGELVDALGRYEAVGVTDLVVHWPRPSDPYRGDVARFERVVQAVVAG
jgi:alkanesulfonate monooxygenase SsuD/methylene tetrahydromethanopterin reductase-like flavin-dependent oxidoreductase (luciferase family)